MNVLVIILFVALLFSATFKKKVEMLCRDILTDPIRVVVGELGEVSAKNGKRVLCFGVRNRAV